MSYVIVFDNGKYNRGAGFETTASRATVYENKNEAMEAHRYLVDARIVDTADIPSLAKKATKKTKQQQQLRGPQFIDRYPRPSDEELENLYNLLVDLRGQVGMERHFANQTPNRDAADVFRGCAERLGRQANVLHKCLQFLGKTDVGPRID